MEARVKRGETLPLKIGSRACADEIRVAAIKKHSDFNQRFDKKAEYKLLFRDGTDVEFIPGTNEPFLLRRYKEESGFGYARITLYLFAPENNTHDEVKKEGCERLYISSDELSDEELMKPVFLAQSQPSQSSASTPFTPIAGPSGVMMIDCPTCWQSFAISDIESHADMCAQKVADFSDPFEQEEDNLIAPPAVYKASENDILNLKDVIAELGESIPAGANVRRVTVRRKHLWEDYVKAHNSHYSPYQQIKITFSGEPAIDGGGPKREFFCEMLEFCKRRLFSNGQPTTSVLSLSKEDFRVAGELMAMSIIQGGPAPNFLAPEVYRVVARDFAIDQCKTEFLKETCQKLRDASDNQISAILMEDKVLDVLQDIGYNGVPSRENGESVQNIIQSICMHDQTPQGSLPSIFQLEDGLKTYGLLYSMRTHPHLWRAVFTEENLSIDNSSFADQFVYNFSLSQLKKEKEIDVHYHFSNYIQSLDSNGLGAFLKWLTGSRSIPPLGLPKKIAVNFLHGCESGCKCRPTTSTCDLCLTIPVHLDDEVSMKIILASAIGDAEGFGHL